MGTSKLLLLLIALIFAQPSSGQPDEAGQRELVAILAAKLDQWLQCRRQTSFVSAGSGNGNHSGEWSACEAHFDGRLCWPACQAGQIAQLACPRATSREQMTGLPMEQIAPASLKLTNVEQTNKPWNKTDANTTSGESIGVLAASTKDLGDETRTRAVARRKCNQIQPGPQETNLMRKAEVDGSGAEVALGRGSSSAAAAKWDQAADYSNCEPLFAMRELNSADRMLALRPTTALEELTSADGPLFGRLADELDRIEATIDPYNDPEMLEQWTICIGDILADFRRYRTPSAASPDRQLEELQQFSYIGSEGNHSDLTRCPVIFDGWRCWPATRAGEVAYVSCPSNQPGFTPDRKAHKICTPNGTWYKHPLTNRYWSNYTTCVDTQDLAFRTKILNLYVIGNLISLVALTASLIIFISFKSLKCTRVTIHKNLFLSFITNNLMWIIWYTYVVSDANLLQSNPIECQVWHIILHYFLVSNYFWMFCEGLYLHTLLVVAFVSDDKIIKWFYLIGWLIPIPITIAYAYYRSYDDYYTNFCWMDESPYNLILMAPIGFSLLLNLIFLINIVRVLVTKLRANNSPDAHQTRKAVRATLILIPLLGLHYILTPFRPEAKSEWEVIYETLTALCTSFQGLCVAMLFCFCNGEVCNVIRKKLKDSFSLNKLFGSGRQNRRQSQQFKTGKRNSSLVSHRNSQCFGEAQIRLVSTCNSSSTTTTATTSSTPLARAGNGCKIGSVADAAGAKIVDLNLCKEMLQVGGERLANGITPIRSILASTHKDLTIVENPHAHYQDQRNQKQRQHQNSGNEAYSQKRPSNETTTSSLISQQSGQSLLINLPTGSPEVNSSAGSSLASRQFSINQLERNTDSEI